MIEATGASTNLPRGWRLSGPDVYYTDESVALVGAAEIEFLKNRAADSPRVRSRICTHGSPQDGFHEMLIVHHRDAYVRPHQHFGKSESLHVIEGEALFVLFGDDGTPRKYVPLTTAGEGASFYYRVPELTWHTLVITSEWFVFHEATTGPFVAGQTHFAPWAPDGSDRSSTRTFLDGLLRRSNNA